MEEELRDIRGYENLYQVSNTGKIKSLAKKIISNRRGGMVYVNIREKILKQKKYPSGYFYIDLGQRREFKHFYVARLVAMAFIDNPNNKPQVNHKNGIKSNNCSNNLEWVTASQNSQHAYDIGLNKRQIREMHFMWGKHHSKATRNKMSIAQKGEKNHNWGKHPSKEIRIKIGRAWLGRKHTKETRAKMKLSAQKRWAKIRELKSAKP